MSAPPATIVDLNGLLVELQKVNNHIVDVSERHNYAAEGRNNRNTQFILDNTNRAADYTNAAVERNGFINLQATDDVKDTVLAAAGALGIQNEKNTNEVLTWADRHQIDTKNQLKDFANDTIRDFSVVQRDQAHFERNISGKIDNVLNQVQLQAANNKSDLLQYQATQFAALQLQASNNKTDVLQKISDCCCEIKQLVGAGETSRLRDALYAADTKNTVLQSTCYPACGGRSFGRRSPR